MNNNTKAHLAALGANFLFGINYAAVKYVTPSLLGAFGLNIARAVSAVALFWLLYIVSPTGKPGIDKKDISRFILCGALGVAINQMLFVKGLSLTTSIHAALLSLVTPIFIIFIAAWVLKEMLNLNKIAGLVLGVTGAALLILKKDTTHTGSNILLGDLFVIGNAIVYAFFMVMVRPLMQRYSPLHVIRWVFTIGFVMMLPFGFNEFVHAQWSSFTFSHWMALALVCLGGTFLSYLGNMYSISIIGPSATGSYIYTQPFFATFIAMIVMHEHFDFYKAGCAVLIFAGVYLVNYKVKSKQ